ncbi:MAG: outer membrane protein [Hyphomicrobiaceae bacterium]
MGLFALTVFVAPPAVADRAAPTSGLSSERASAILRRLSARAAQPEAPPVPLGVWEAVRIAVENNPGIRAQAEVPALVSQNVLTALAAYDPSLSVRLEASDVTFPAVSDLTAGPSQSTFKEKSQTGELGLAKTLITGGRLGIIWENVRTENNSQFTRHTPEFTPALRLGIEQPLLRNFAGIQERTAVIVARQDSARAIADFEAELSAFVGEVIEAYWETVLAKAELRVEQRSLELARELVREARTGVDVGVLPPVAVQEADADAAGRQELVLRARNRLEVAERQLQYRVMLDANGSGAPRRIAPIDNYQVEALELNRETILEAAVQRRPEIHAAALDLDTAHAEESQARRGKLPELTLIARYGLAGLAGKTRNPTIVEGTQGEEDTVVLSPFDGDYGDSLDALGSGDFNQAVFGLELEMPLANAAAKAEHAKAVISIRRSARQLEQTVSDVALEIERALADVSSAYERVGASRLARELAEQNLHNQQRRYELGAVTTKDVLDFQTRLAEGLAAEVQAITDHAKAVARLHQADGTLLEKYEVAVETPQAPGRPWWAAF